MRMLIDIDGTLTDLPNKRWGNPRHDIIEKVKTLIAEGNRIILWSAGGRKYAKDFAKKYSINASGYIFKPDIMVDDKSTLRTHGIPIISPDDFLKKDFNEKKEEIAPKFM